jgi:hypothetical protein
MLARLLIDLFPPHAAAFWLLHHARPPSKRG